MNNLSSTSSTKIEPTEGFLGSNPIIGPVAALESIPGIAAIWHQASNPLTDVIPVPPSSELADKANHLIKFYNKLPFTKPPLRGHCPIEQAAWIKSWMNEEGKQTILDCRHLNLRSFSPDDKLTSLPPEIGLFKNLETLNLAGNQLTALPAEIGQLTELQRLFLNNNQLTTLLPEMGGLKRLEILELNNNQLTTLPTEIGNLRILRTLDLHHNQLVNLPAEFWNLTALQELNLSSNQLTALAPEIERLAELEWLKLEDNQLTTLPPQIGQLRKLLELHLHNNRLTALPSEIGNLIALREINLSDNQLSVVPDRLCHLSSDCEVIAENNPYDLDLFSEMAHRVLQTISFPTRINWRVNLVPTIRYTWGQLHRSLSPQENNRCK